MNDTATDTRITITLTRWHPVTQAQWDDFCKAAGLELGDDGWFAGEGLRAGCDRGTATFDGPQATRTAVAFWLKFGGRVRADATLDGEIDGILRERTCMTGTGKVPLISFGWVPRLQAWAAYTRDDVVPLRALAGLTVSLGTKDGVAYEGVTVASFNSGSGELALTGGTFAHLYRDTDPAPLVTGGLLHADDIARGCIHPTVAELQLSLLTSESQQDTPAKGRHPDDRANDHRGHCAEAGSPRRDRSG